MKQKYHAKHFYSLFWIFLFQIFVLNIDAQTVHISPTGDGGFELGPTFADNGWTVNTPASSALTQWVCNTGAAGYSDSRCAYVSNNAVGTPPPNSYENATRISHLYRNVTIPASNTQIDLSFKWKCVGESAYDRMRIWLVPITYTPDNATEINTIGAAPTGRIFVGRANYSESSTWGIESIVIPASYAGTTFRIVFEWRNDGSLRNDPPIAIDNISLTSQILSAYCAAGGTNSSRYINNFSTSGGISNINNPSTYSAGGYGNYTSQAVLAAPGSTVGFSSTFMGGTFGFKIWVDWNSNSVFDASETMYASGGFQAALTGTITVPAGAPAGNYRMRIRANWNESDPVACGSTGSGEIEDYTFTVQPLTCPTVPSSLAVNAITTTSANFNWTAASPPPGSGYTYYYSTSATPPTFASTGTGTVTGINVSLLSLTSGTQYYAWVRSNCGGANGMGAWAGPVTFTTSIANNECTNAIVAPVNSTQVCTNTISGTSVGATQSQVGCVGNADDDVWYKFVATNTAHTITVTEGTMSDSVFQLFSGTCAALIPMACSDPNSATIGSLTIGNTYYIRIYSYFGAGNQGTFTLCITTPPPPPANDECINAVLAPVNAGATCTNTISGTTINATQSQSGCAGTADDDVWYKFVATSTAHTVTITTGTLSDSVFQVFSGTCGTLTPILCSDPPTATFGNLVVGNTYYVRVYSYGAGYGAGTFTLCISTPPPPPANDECINAIVAPVNSGYACTNTVSGTTQSSTQSQPGCTGNADDDVWYKFTATSTSHIITVSSGGLSDSVFEVFSGSCASLTSILCSDPESASVSGLIVGSTYYIRIYSYFGAGNQGTFTLCITTPAPITNDNCTTAILVSVSPDSSCTTSVTGATIGATQSQAGCVGVADDDVWYKFVAIATTHIINITEGTMSDSVFQVFSGGCAGLTSLLCSDPNTGTVTGLTIGSTYFIRIYSYSNGSGQGTFTFCITSPEPACTPGTGMGMSNACVITAAGGVGLSGAPAPAVTCTSGAQCVILEANYLALGQTTNYAVTSIPYAPPYQFSCLANAVSANVDDVWSPLVSLPFNFCFYGNTYSNVVISSNGVISFDTSSNPPGGYSTWSFNDNLPSTNLFKNSIFGVYHDINPRLGGTIGWELIELNSGCRALVAAWSNVPMFSCTSSMYTGMMVLYENTNIIEIYIKEKNVCASWNYGNAIVGIQNATGTQAVVAPGRNGLSPDWTVNSEAWRFTPSGTSITTVNWFQGNTATGTVLGTANTLSVCPETTTNYTARVNYALCGGGTLTTSATTTVTISGKAKTWNGSVDNNWNVAANWTPSGVPTAINCVTIPTTTNQAIIANAASAGSVALTNSGKLIINSDHSLEIQRELSVAPSANFLIEDSGSLVQVDNSINSGIMKMERITRPMYRYDYSYWNSPVTAGSSFTLSDLSPATLADKYYRWQPFVGVGSGNWIQQPPSTVMDPNRGYIVRAPQTFSTSSAPADKQTYKGIFAGTPNNGIVNVSVSHGTMPGSTSDDNWNLIGNPYPSAVSTAAFLSANSTVVDGTIYVWTHNSALSAGNIDPFYGSFTYNYSGADYASWNSLATTAATSGGPVPNGYIAAGSSFFIKSKVSLGAVQFNNSMRVRGNNNQFFRNLADTASTSPTDFEKHRIWLNMMNTSSAFSQIVIGYAEGATLGYDSGLDAERLSSATTAFYSTTPDYNLVIQGRPLPFDAADIVPLGYITDINGEFSIGIQETDPLFSDYEILLEDKYLNSVHNLKISPYFFTTTVGRFDNRFVLRYLDNLLEVNDYESNSMLSAFIKDQYLKVKSSAGIETVTIFDMTGKRITVFKPEVETGEHQWRFPFAQGAYFAKFKLSSGVEITRKLIH